MLISTQELLEKARRGRYAIGAFNVYTLEQVRAVLQAAEALESPVILQVLPKALETAGTALIKACLEAGRCSSVKVSVQLDHCSCESIMERALAAGVSSLMADGSHLDYEGNIAFTCRMVDLAGRFSAGVEAELGRLTGTEDGLTVAQYETKLTDPVQAADFAARTHTHALAVCIGNLHGKYHRPPELDFERLAAIQRRVNRPIVLHGTSGLPDSMIRRCIDLGVCKFNVNTELRAAHLQALRSCLANAPGIELVDLIQTLAAAVQVPVQAKIELFGSGGKS